MRAPANAPPMRGAVISAGAGAAKSEPERPVARPTLGRLASPGQPRSASALVLPHAVDVQGLMIGAVTQGIDARPERRADGEAAAIFFRRLTPDCPGVRVQPAGLSEGETGLMVSAPVQ